MRCEAGADLFHKGMMHPGAGSMPENQKTAGTTRAIQDRFDAFVTIDSNLEFQQHIQGRPIIIVVIRAASNRLEDLIPLAAEIDSAISLGQPGAVVYLGTGAG